MIGVSFDTSVLERKFTRLEREQLPFAMALTLTWTARDMQEAEKRAMPQEYDRPTRFTVEGVFFKAATKTKLEAFVFLRNEATKGTPPVKYLAPGVYGGGRGAKRYEKALRNIGAIKGNEVTVPASGAKLNAYGNVSTGTIVQMLANLGANTLSGTNTPTGRGYKRRGKRPKKDWFVGQIGQHFGQRAIFQRRGPRELVPVFLLVEESDVTYPKQFAFFEIARDTFKRTFRGNWDSAFKYALATRK
jgi:hypothetical protein